MAQVTWTPQALDDLDAICLFIARDAPQVAAVFADRVSRATDRLIYRIRQDQVQVVTVHHGARPLDVGKIEGAA
jgi:plasmid stabilization system protein ParE